MRASNTVQLLNYNYNFYTITMLILVIFQILKTLLLLVFL